MIGQELVVNALNTAFVGHRVSHSNLSQSHEVGRVDLVNDHDGFWIVFYNTDGMFFFEQRLDNQLPEVIDA